MIKSEATLLMEKTVCKIKAEGFNLSFINHPAKANTYLATIRRKEKLSEEEYPTIKNHVHLLTLNEGFEVLHSVEMKEDIVPPRKTFDSFTCGIEDCRLINGNMMSAVVLDSNNNWIPEMCICYYNWETGKITKMLCFGENDLTPQKNWLALYENLTMIHFLHSYSPLKVISVDKDSGMIRTEHYQKIFNLEGCEMHGGACVYMENKKQFLVNVRVVQNHAYQYSLWLLFSQKYKIIGSSEPFTFFERKKEADFYEMCMSVVDKDDSLFASVSLCDQEVFILKYSLKDILSTILLRKTLQL